MRTKNVSREATVAQFREEFLKGRSAQAREEFLARPLERQYSSIIQWRRNKRIREATPQSTTDILDTLTRVDQMIANATEISEADRNAIAARLEAIGQHLDTYMEQQRARNIEALEQESRRINQQLQELRGW